MPISKISVELITTFFNSRDQREKTLLVILGICFLVAADILLIVQPALNSFFKIQPQLHALHEELRGLEQDKKNEKQIESQWRTLNGKMEGLNRRFVSSSEVLAEDLSTRARESGLKISSLTPAEKSQDNSKAGAYAQASIKIRAEGGVHSLGKFLAKVESSALFFRVNNLTIRENPADVRNQQIEMNVECYRKI